MDDYEFIKSFFSRGGVLEQNFPEYEFRESQLEMALAVYESLMSRRHIFIEAPTGIGKTFAYLVPAILIAKKYNRKAIVSTNTINLQDQIIQKDIPLLEKIFPFKFSSAILKGKNNYVCPHRLEKAFQNHLKLFEDYELSELIRIYEWAEKTQDGTLSDIKFKVDFNIWSFVCAENGICTNKTCGSYSNTQCFYKRAKDRLNYCELLIVNHYLLLNLMILTEEEKEIKGYLYNDDFVIFDEGHSLETAVSEHITQTVSREMLKYNLSRVYNPQKKKGLLVNYNGLYIIPTILDLMDATQEFFATVRREAFYNQNLLQSNAVRYFKNNLIENILDYLLEKLVAQLKGLTKFCKDEIDLNQINYYAAKFESFRQIINDFLFQELPIDKYVYWVEVSSPKENSNVSLCIAPVDISNFMRTRIFNAVNSSIVCSATLTVNNSFSYMKEKMGAERSIDLQLSSPFDFQKQMTMYIPENIAEPDTNITPQYLSELARYLLHFIDLTEGKALVLFTNKMVLEQVARKVKGVLKDKGIQLLEQMKGMSRRYLLELFKSDVNSVLFGLDSFWFGVDVPGESLSNLIITRLPFLVPTHPRIQAKLELIERRGGNSFYEYILPEAILKFKQGIGRLIRSKSDSGIIVVLDPRIIRKPYGRFFFNSIEKCNIKVV
ncbi:MAG: ATP-dependent DNA helicase [Ignavibacteria bacterium]